MFEAKEVKQNTVSATDQLPASSIAQVYDRKMASMRILFVGNSITFHGVKEDIGWSGNWGMAASCPEKDYVHQTVHLLEERGIPTAFSIAHAGGWEATFDTAGETWKDSYLPSIDFHADVVVIRLGENIPSERLDTMDIRPYVEDMIAYFGQGASQIIVTDCFWKRERLDSIFEEISHKNGYTFCPLSDLYADKKTMALGQYEHQGVALHPSDYGMEQIAKRIAACIK